MSIRSLSFTIAIVTLVLFASALPKPAVAQAPIVVLGPQEFGIVTTKPYPKYTENMYCKVNAKADDTYFILEPRTPYSPNGYLLFYYLDEHKQIAHDEASVDNLTVVTDDTASAPKAPIARLIRMERGQGVWEIVVTTDMKKAYSGCLGKLKTQ
jgi:hypothetical protein